MKKIKNNKTKNKSIVKSKNLPTKSRKDPHYKREAEKYAYPVPSREFITQFLKSINRPVSLAHLLDHFSIRLPEEKEGLRRRLIAMQRDGQILSNRKGSFALIKKMELIKGRIQAHRDGFGFLIPEDNSPDIFIPAREMRQVFTDDVVLVRITNSYSRRREGAIAEILVRNTHRILGRYFLENGVAFVEPVTKGANQDIVVTQDASIQAIPGQFVVIEITAQPTIKRQAVGRLVEILGDQLTPGMEVELAIRAYDIPYQWPKNLELELSQLKKKHDLKEAKDRQNVCHLPFVTIWLEGF